MLKLEKGTVQDLINFEGKRIMNTRLIDDINNGNCEYYILKKEESIIDDICVFVNEDNLISLNSSFLTFRHNYKYVFEELKKYYKNLTIEHDISMYGTEYLDLLKKYYFVYDEYTKTIDNKYIINGIKILLGEIII